MKTYELDKKLKASLKELAEETDKAKVSQQMIDFFDFSAKFHNYSAGNLWLIYSAKPDATMVAGYTAWRKMGRYVKKGEKGIPIYAPIITKDEEDNSRLVAFKVVYVFDVSQTEGEELPEAPTWISSERQEALSEALKAFCIGKHIQIEETELSGETQGLSAGGKIILSPNAGTKTFVHEIAHELMHKELISIPRNIKELEAESVAYIVSKHFGIKNLNSPNYIALHDNDPNEILDRMQRIMSCAKEIINFVEKEVKDDQTINEQTKVYA